MTNKKSITYFQAKKEAEDLENKLYHANIAFHRAISALKGNLNSREYQVLCLLYKDKMTYFNVGKLLDITGRQVKNIESVIYQKILNS